MTQLATYVGLAHDGEKALADSFQAIAISHPEEGDLGIVCLIMAGLCHRHRHRLAPLARRYDAVRHGDHDHVLGASGAVECHGEPDELVRELQDAYVLATLVLTTWTVVEQGARVRHDHELADAAVDAVAGTRRQIAWLGIRLRQVAPRCLGAGEDLS